MKFIKVTDEEMRALCSATVPRGDVTLIRRGAFYFLRTVFEGPTVTLSWLLVLYAVMWTLGTGVAEWPIDVAIHENIATVIPPTIYGILFIAVTFFQFMCHTAIRCGARWRTFVALVVVFCTSQTVIAPTWQQEHTFSTVLAGNITMMAVAFLVLSRSFPTWFKHENQE